MPNSKQNGRSGNGVLAGRKVRLALGLAVTMAFCVQCHESGPTAPGPVTNVDVERVSTAAIVTEAVDRNERMAKEDPLGFLQYCWDRYRRNVQDYRCTFTKQELIQGEVLPEQSADVRFRQEPFSVDMTFIKNVRSCKRALYVKGQWVDDAGNELAWVEPGGSIIRAFISKIKQPIHGARAEKESRRNIDQFGFDKSFELIMKYSIKAKEEGALRLDYVGHGVVDGRPTYVLERDLPYTGGEEPYPDDLLVIHIDQEYLVPTACFSYADEKGESLLGKYVYTDIELNPGYTADDFDPEKINF